MSAKRLTPRQKKFIGEYLVDLNATQAAIRSGYAVKGAEQTGSYLLRHPKVAAALSEARIAWQQRTEITTDRVLREYARIAFANLSQVMTWDERESKLKASADIGEEVHPAISQVKIKRKWEPDENGMMRMVEEREVRMHDKNAALNALSRHLGLFPKEGVTVNMAPDLATLVKMARDFEEEANRE